MIQSTTAVRTRHPTPSPGSLPVGAEYYTKTGAFVSIIDYRRFDSLVQQLVKYADGAVFNQYRDVHPMHDLPHAAAVRQQNLRAFLSRFDRVHYVLLAEAAGYQGCRFSGIPMTSEAQIVGPEALHWARNGGYERSSSRSTLWREPSATILWETLGERLDCLIWNTVPWHPVGKRGPLSNRTPLRAEIVAGLEVLECLLELAPTAQLVAVGRVAEKALVELGREPCYVRHPAHGGKPQFVSGIRALPDVGA